MTEHVCVGTSNTKLTITHWFVVGDVCVTRCGVLVPT
jgi:hypothetical protein